MKKDDGKILNMHQCLKLFFLVGILCMFLFCIKLLKLYTLAFMKTVSHSHSLRGSSILQYISDELILYEFPNCFSRE